MNHRFLKLIAVLSVLSGSPLAFAQELTPRTYWPAPVGTQVLLLGYSHQNGDVITDASLPIVGVDSRIHNGVVAYQRTLGLFGRTSNVRVEFPFAKVSTAAELNGMPVSRDITGTGDVSVTLAVNLVGAPSMTREQFRAFRADPQPIVAASIKLVAPTGRYDEDRLINIGSNRWAGRVQLGYIQPLTNRWVVEMSVGNWFFNDNDDFLGKTLRQESITSFDFNLIHRFGPGFWASVDATYYMGGKTRVEGAAEASFKRNARLGVSVAYPFSRQHALKANYSSGVVTESGGDYDTIGLTYLFLF